MRVLVKRVEGNNFLLVNEETGEERWFTSAEVQDAVRKGKEEKK